VGGVQVPRFEIQSASGLICTSVAPSKRVVSQSDTRSRLVLATRTACLTAVGSSGRPATAAASRVRGMANKNPNSAPAAAAAQAVSPYNIGDGDTMILPDMAATTFEGEAELAVVIGKRASHVKAADAMSYAFGYTNFIDGSARGVVPPTNVFYQMKSRDTFAPIGPYIVTADEIKDPHKLQIRLTNNGVVMQNFNTDDMAHKIPRCIEWITSIHTLHPGDILATGTNHRGLNPFMDGDNIDLTCEGCGTLHIAVRDDLKRTWARITRLQHKQSGAEGAHTKQIGGKYASSK